MLDLLGIQKTKQYWDSIFPAIKLSRVYYFCFLKDSMIPKVSWDVPLPTGKSMN